MHSARLLYNNLISHKGEIELKNLILRNTPDIADIFDLRDIPCADGKNTYEVYCEDGKIVIAGDCKISQAMGYYAYLKKYCRVNFSHCGNTQINISQAPLFEGKLSKIIPQKRRAYLNYCTFGYSTAFWKWDRWEKEIDFMAMNGINMPLSIVGSEAVWYYTLRDFKYSEKGALSYLSGPGFWAWQLMGNIDSYFSLTDVKYIEERLELGKKIIDREVELGMTPIQQGFSGTIPRTLRRCPEFPRFRMALVKGWCNFRVTCIIDPTDVAFKKFGTAFLEKQRQLFGSYHYYICDPFHENEPPVKQKDYLWKVGRAIDTMYKDFDPESVWVMQSWSLREKLVKSIPVGRLLILDIDGSKHDKTEEFWGHDYIMGSIHSFGDRTTLHGSIGKVASNEYSQNKAANCVGTGLFPEGIYQNPLYYDLAFQMLTEDKPVDLDSWLDDYAERRWGSDEKCLKEAAYLLHKSCYNDNCTGRETGSVICARPDTELRHTAPNDHRELRYENKDLLEAVKTLLKAENADTDGYVYDVCDITRQVLSNYCSVLFDSTIKGFREKDVKSFERSSNAFLRICDELDELLQTRPEFTLAKHLTDADELAVKPEDEELAKKERENFELNLLTQVTVWGPVADSVNYDYAWKEWGGLIGTYYAKRWQSFYEQLAIEFPHKRKFSTATKHRYNERNEYRGNDFCKRFAEFEKKWLATADPAQPTDGDTVAIARELIEKYESRI